MAMNSKFQDIPQYVSKNQEFRQMITVTGHSDLVWLTCRKKFCFQFDYKNSICLAYIAVNKKKNETRVMCLLYCDFLYVLEKLYLNT